jgi:hypothetical protein
MALEPRTSDLEPCIGVTWEFWGGADCIHRWGTPLNAGLGSRVKVRGDEWGKIVWSKFI